jgi:hypothetical protein
MPYEIGEVVVYADSWGRRWPGVIVSKNGRGQVKVRLDHDEEDRIPLTFGASGKRIGAGNYGRISTETPEVVDLLRARIRWERAIASIRSVAHSEANVATRRTLSECNRAEEILMNLKGLILGGVK